MVAGAGQLGRNGPGGPGQDGGLDRDGAGAGPGGGGGRACSCIKRCVGIGYNAASEEKTRYFSPDFPWEVPIFTLDIPDFSR